MERSELLTACIAGLVGIAIIAANVLATRGFDFDVLPDRVPPTADAMAARDRPNGQCHAMWTEAPTVKCAPHSNVLVWGDSMGYAWMPAFAGADEATRDACPPMVGHVPGPTAHDRTCREFNDVAVERARHADTVVLVAWWMRRPDLAPLEATLEQLQGVRRVVLVGPTPIMQKAVPTCIHLQQDCGMTRAAFDAEARPILSQMHAFAKRFPNVEVLDVSNRFCTPTDCPPVLNGVALYWDTHHVSSTAARGVLQ
jgi:hypothetical protein